MEKRETRREYTPLTEENIRETVRLYNLGYKNSIIAERLDILASTTSGIIAEYRNPGKNKRSTKLMVLVIREILREEKGLPSLSKGITKPSTNRGTRTEKRKSISLTEKEIREVIFHHLNHRDPKEISNLMSGLYQGRIRRIIEYFYRDNHHNQSKVQKRVYKEIREEMKKKRSLKYIRDNYGYGSPVHLFQDTKKYLFGLIKIKRKYE